ncbi:unnamed protein product [Malus baccata var. baccata]
MQLFMFCRFHWLLAIIDPYEELVYYMDSLNWIQIDHGMKDIVELALKMFKAQKGIKEGTIECGYYVMKYMEEIIDDPNCSIIYQAEYVDDFIPIDETLD